VCLCLFVVYTLVSVSISLPCGTNTECDVVCLVLHSRGKSSQVAYVEVSEIKHMWDGKAKQDSAGT
jgi:hypothetical protein